MQLSERARHLSVRLEWIDYFLKRYGPACFVRYDNLRNFISFSRYYLDFQRKLAQDCENQEELAAHNSAMMQHVAEIAEAAQPIELSVLQRTILRAPEKMFLSERKQLGLEVSHLCDAIDRIYIYFVRLYLGRTPNPNECYFAVTTLTSEFEHDPPLAAAGQVFNPIYVPVTDITRTRLWAGIAHEAAHTRIDNYVELNKDKHAGDEFRGLADSLAYDLSRNVLSKSFGSLDYDKQNKITRQVNEIYSDYCSCLLVGPASPLSLACYSDASDSWFYKKKRIRRGPDLTKRSVDLHPPMPCRIRYMLRILSRYPNSSRLRADMRIVRNSWNETIKSLNVPPKIRLYAEKYSAVVANHDSEIVEFVRKNFILCERDQIFTPQNWENAKRYERKLFEASDLEMDPISLLNAVWIRRIKKFPHFLKKARTIGQCVVMMEKENTYTKHIVDAINQMVSANGELNNLANK